MKRTTDGSIRSLGRADRLGRLVGTNEPMKKKQNKPAVKLESTRQAHGVQDTFREKLTEIAQTADSCDHYCTLLDELVTKTIDVSCGDKEVLSGVRTALNKEMFDTSGASGVNYKGDYGLLQILKTDPDIGPMLCSLEKWVIELDKLILQPPVPHVLENSEITLTTRKVPVKACGKVISYIYLEDKSDFVAWQNENKQEIKESEDEPGRIWPLPSLEIQRLLLERENLVNQAANYYLELATQFGVGDSHEWLTGQGWQVEKYLPPVQAERFCRIEGLLRAAHLSKRPLPPAV